MSDFFNQIRWGKLLFSLLLVFRCYAIKHKELEKVYQPAVPNLTYQQSTQPWPSSVQSLPRLSQLAPSPNRRVESGSFDLGLSRLELAQPLSLRNYEYLRNDRRRAVEGIK